MPNWSAGPARWGMATLVNADREVRSDHSGAEDAAECDPVSISRILFANASAACKEQKSPTTAPCNSGLIAVPSEVPAAMCRRTGSRGPVMATPEPRRPQLQKCGPGHIGVPPTAQLCRSRRGYGREIPTRCYPAAHPAGARSPSCTTRLHATTLGERAADRTPSDAEALRDLRGSQRGTQLFDLRRVADKVSRRRWSRSCSQRGTELAMVTFTPETGGELWPTTR